MACCYVGSMDYQAPPVSPRESRSISPIAAVIGTLAWGVVGLGSLGMLMMSAMMFDAPGSEHNPYLWVIVGSLIALPLLCLASVVGGWVALAITGHWDSARARAGRRIRMILVLLPLPASRAW